MALRDPPGLQKRAIFEPQCTHLTMTRLYSPKLLCSSCDRPGPFGWLYQCTQDRDDFLEHLAARGDLSNLDSLGSHLTSNMGLRQGSPAARENPLSFFDEVTQQQMAHYKPDQIAKILKQRENVRLVIQEEISRVNSAAILNRLTQPNNAVGAPPCSYEYHKPWLHSFDEECQYRVCFRCRSSCADRAYLSLNAVAKGEILPTAAAGYGFHILGDRPIIDANVVKKLGCRPVPKATKPESPSSHLSDTAGTPDGSSPTSSVDVMELLDAQIAQSQMLTRRMRDDATDSADSMDSEDSEDEFGWPATPTSTESSPGGNLKHSPRCENLGLFTKASSDSTEVMTPLSWTPPPSPTPVDTGIDEAGEEIFESPMGPTGCKGAKSHDLSAVKKGSFLPSIQAVMNHSRGHVREGSVDETGNDSGLESKVKKSGGFAPSPLRIGQGMAMMEESVELGVADVITRA